VLFEANFDVSAVSNFRVLGQKKGPILQICKMGPKDNLSDFINAN